MVFIGAFIFYKTCSILIKKINTKRFKWVQNYFHETSEDFKYNGIVRMLIENFLDYHLLCLMNIANFYTDEIINVSSDVFSVIAYVRTNYLRN